MTRRKKKIILWTLGVLLFGVVAGAGLPLFTYGIREATPPAGRLADAPAQHLPRAPRQMTVMTVNLAHGRKDGSHQLFLRSSTIKQNLDAVAAVLRRENPDVVALQEADGPSAWSGGFNHVRYLARRAAYPYFIRGAHVQGLKLSYGTALLSHWPLSEALSFTFAPSWPTFSKGFVIATVQLPGGTPVDVASLHLDFARAAVRASQIRELIRKISGRRKPLVVMGDFNCDWSEPKTLPVLAEALQLKAYQPTRTTPVTFPSLSGRLDWILVCGHFSFSTYTVLSDTLSDHRAVKAVIRLRND